MKPGGVFLALALTACSQDGIETPAPSGALGASLAPTVAARVGAEEILVDEVRAVAAAQGIAVAQALEALISDAALAEEARARGIAQRRETAASLQATLARTALRALFEEASKGPPTSDELKAAEERFWLDVDRPEAFRTIHAVVILPKEPDSPTKARALAVAVAVRRVVDELPAPQMAPPTQPQSAYDPWYDGFKSAVEGVDAGGFEVKVEQLSPVVSDGRTTEPGAGEYAKEYAEAASKLARRGDVSPVVESPFGYHVILLLDRIPAKVLSGADRATFLTQRIFRERAKLAQQKLLDRLRVEAQVESAADAMLSQVQVAER